jgi:hypothetical protein
MDDIRLLGLILIGIVIATALYNLDLEETLLTGLKSDIYI